MPVCICKSSRRGRFPTAGGLNPGWKNPCAFRPRRWEPVYQRPGTPEEPNPGLCTASSRPSASGRVLLQPCGHARLLHLSHPGAGLGPSLEEGISDIPAARRTVSVRAFERLPCFIFCGWRTKFCIKMTLIPASDE